MSATTRPKPKHLQYSNRSRRIPKRLVSLKHEMDLEKQCAKDENREPVLYEMLSQENRLKARFKELGNVE